ncbi:MAG: hypothetical protein JWP97_4126 [Labilithrix sp.]|nr:hypothetical protein [Labilithrix sp.]
MRKTAIVVVALAAAVLGPRVSAPHDRPAGTAFEYHVPEGFSPVSPAPADGSEEWSRPVSPGHPLAPRLTLKKLRKGGNVETSDLQVIAGGMPGVLQPSGVSWSTVRLETRQRADGTRVGLIEGDCSKTTDDVPAAGTVTLSYRRLMLVFPTDEGTALVTALYGKDEIDRWQPVFEGSALDAKGVALRVPPPPGWMHAAWALAGLVLAWFGSALWERRHHDDDARAAADAAKNA